jgi:hypothetical protein
LKRQIIPRKKITGYLLSPSHRDGRGKAAFFARFGFTADSWQTLAGALLQHAATHEVAKVEASPVVRVIWFIDSGEEIPRFVTAYPQ